MNRYRVHLVNSLAAVLFTATLTQAAPAQAATSKHQSLKFTPVTLVAGQRVRLTLVNLVDPPQPDRGGIPPDPVHALVRFFDGAGRPVGNVVGVDIGTGESKLVVAPLVTSSDAPLAHLRATVLLPPNTARNTVDVNFEIFDTRSNATLFMNPGVIRGFNPQPDPPGFEFAE